MNDPKSKTNSNGGAVAIRGFLVQTLVALLDITQAESAFTEITLEPQIGNDQFDFYWKDANGAHAVQVKSTQNDFKKTDIEQWAKKLQAARTNEQCRLILVGNIPPKLNNMKLVELVKIESMNLKAEKFVGLAAHSLAIFLESEQMDAGTAKEREKVAHALTSKLEHLSTRSETLTRPAFIQLLRDWITSTPKEEFRTHLEHFDVFRYTPTELIGREAEMQILENAWDQAMRGDIPRPHVLTFVALGGEGKTALIAKWAADWVNEQGRGGTAIFAWSFYSQGTRDQSSASSDLFLKEALVFFGDAELANSPQHPYEKAKQLAKLIGKQKALLILDGVEPLQYAPTSPTAGELKDQAIATLLKNLASNSQGLCVLTTRYSIPNLRTFWQSTAPEIKLLRLSPAAGVRLLEFLEVKGKPAELEKLVEDVKGHALTLNLLGSYLRDAYAGDIRKLDLVKLSEANEDVQGGHAFRVMDAYVQWLQSDDKKGRQALAMWQLLGLFDRPAPADCLAELLKAPAIPHLTKELMGLTEAQRNIIFSRLKKANLLTVNRDATYALVSLDTHPLIREYFAEKLRCDHLGDWQNAHRRIYEHLCKTKEGEQPTLEQLQPLFQAVAHGCAAGLHREALDVYYDRIRRNRDAYVPNRIGGFGEALSALSHFFDKTWNEPIKMLESKDQLWLLGEVALFLEGSAKLEEAKHVKLLELKILLRRLGELESKSISTNNLGEILLMLGEVESSIDARNASKEYALLLAEENDDYHHVVTKHAALAYTLHQAGKVSQSQALFEFAEKIGQDKTQHQFLYSRNSYYYCDLLLTQNEIKTINERTSYIIKLNSNKTDSLASALNQLIKALLELKEIVENDESILKYVTQVKNSLDLAVSELRQARPSYVPHGLLARAAYYRHTQQFALAREDLAEVLDIAKPSGMRLHLTDYHLESARLALAEFPVDSAHPASGLATAESHIERAKELIQDTGYNRRLPELEALQAQLKSVCP